MNWANHSTLLWNIDSIGLGREIVGQGLKSSCSSVPRRLAPGIEFKALLDSRARYNAQWVSRDSSSPHGSQHGSPHRRVMPTNVQSEATRSAGLLDASTGLALVRVTIGSMFVWVFFENLGKGLYTQSGYSSLINYYIKASHSPAAWKAVMGLLASHAGIAAPLQAITEISLGVLLVIGLLTRPAAFVAFLFLGSLWISEWGTAWIWELLVPVLASLGLAVGGAGRRWGVDAMLAQRRSSSLRW